jgi:hypothetical protein
MSLSCMNFYIPRRIQNSRIGNQDCFQITVIVTTDINNYLLVCYHETRRFLHEDIWVFDAVYIYDRINFSHSLATVTKAYIFITLSA